MAAAKADGDDDSEDIDLGRDHVVYVIKDFTVEKDLVLSPTPKIKMVSLEPEQGPSYGDTRVLVRGGPFKKWEE